MSLKTRLFSNPYKVPCDVYDCRNRAAYFIGRPDATRAATYKLCDECTEAMLTNLPEELEGVMNMREVNTSNAQEQAKEAEQQRQTESTSGPEPSQLNEGEEMDRTEQEIEEINRIEEENQEPEPQQEPEKVAHSMEESQMDQSLQDQLNNKTVEELKALAKDIGVKGYSKMKKEELVQVLSKGE